MSARDRKPPGWKHWRLLGTVMSWEAAALSLGIDPDSMEPDRHAWMAAPLGHRRLFTKASFRSAQEQTDFDSRFRLIEDAFVRQHVDRVSYHNTGKIPLAAFAAWCVENELDVAPEFAAIGGEAETAADDTSPIDSAPGPQRQDAFSVELHDVLSDMRSKKERLTATTVFARMKRDAGKGGPVVDIAVEGGLIWERTNGRTETMTFAALEKRVANWLKMNSDTTR